MKASNITKTHPLQPLAREQIELALAQGLSETTGQTAEASLVEMTGADSDTATLTIKVRFLPENPEEGTEH